MLSDVSFTKYNLDICLNELAKEYRKLGGKAVPAEIILIGGAAILANYDFRESTHDMDAIIHAASTMKDAINYVGDRLNFPNGWMNADFMKTSSYTPKLRYYSKYYKMFANVLTVRTVTAEYLIAMKLKSGREYKKDQSDVIGILYEHLKMGKPITMEQIEMAVENLYGSMAALPEDSLKLIRDAFKQDDLIAYYQQLQNRETENKNILLEFQEKYPGAAKQENISDILKRAQGKKHTAEQRGPKL